MNDESCLSLCQFCKVRLGANVIFNAISCALQSNAADKQDDQDDIWECGREVHNLKAYKYVMNQIQYSFRRLTFILGILEGMCCFQSVSVPILS